VPTNALTSAATTISWTVRNDGSAEASEPWIDRVYLANSAADADPTFLGDVLHRDAVPIGQSYDQTFTFNAPQSAGSYIIIVNTDPTGLVQEGSKQNNTLYSTQSIVVVPAYRATLKANIHRAPAGTAIPLHGSATLANNQPAA